MPTLNFQLHEKQKEIFLSDARFKVVAAGRRGGKTFLSIIELFVEGLKDEVNGENVKSKEVWYVAPTFEQGKKVMWQALKDIGKDVIQKTHENVCVAILLNGRKIRIVGADRPDALRGVGLSFVVLDEYAFMKPEVWDLIIRPTLADVQGGALFIGTPEGKNHFYDLWVRAGLEESIGWESFHFNSMDNPKIPDSEIEAARQTMSAQAFRQEFEASFEAAGGGSFTESMIRYGEGDHGTIYMAVDPAGFGTGDGMVKSELKRLDETAIAIVDVSPSGWYVLDIISGRWDIRETALRILRAYQQHRPAAVGIEKGALFNAILPYLEDEMRRLGVYFTPQPVTHGKQKKVERITWALQGRFEKGRIILDKNDAWNRKFEQQMLDFPNPMAHDDLLDALAYIDQVAVTNYNQYAEIEEFEPLDAYIGI